MADDGDGGVDIGFPLLPPLFSFVQRFLAYVSNPLIPISHPVIIRWIKLVKRRRRFFKSEPSLVKMVFGGRSIQLSFDGVSPSPSSPMLELLSCPEWIRKSRREMDHYIDHSLSKSHRQLGVLRLLRKVLCCWSRISRHLGLAVTVTEFPQVSRKRFTLVTRQSYVVVLHDGHVLSLSKIETDNYRAWSHVRIGNFLKRS